jgi:putative flippase GtrA
MLLLTGLDERTTLLVAKITATAATTIWNYILYSRVVFTYKVPSEIK